MHFQGPGSREALAALWEGAGAGRLVGPGVAVLHHRLRLPLPPAAVVHQMRLQVPLAPKPDPARLAGEDVLCGDADKGDVLSGHLLYFYVYAQRAGRHAPSSGRSLLFCAFTALTLKARVKRLFQQILGCCVSLRRYHWVGALSQGRTRTLDHLLTEASLSS